MLVVESPWTNLVEALFFLPPLPGSCRSFPIFFIPSKSEKYFEVFAICEF